MIIEIAHGQKQANNILSMHTHTHTHTHIYISYIYTHILKLSAFAKFS